MKVFVGLLFLGLCVMVFAEEPTTPCPNSYSGCYDSGRVAYYNCEKNGNFFVGYCCESIWTWPPEECCLTKKCTYYLPPVPE